MRADELSRHPVERLGLVGAWTGPVRLAVCGVPGGDNFVTGLCVGDTVLQRLPANPVIGSAEETTDALRLRAALALPPDVLRDAKGEAIGFFLYTGLPPEHCYPTSQHIAGFIR